MHLPAGTKGWSEVADHPVWVCLAEATAFCKFAGCRVMTELEYGCLLDARIPRYSSLVTNEDAQIVPEPGSIVYHHMPVSLLGSS